MQDNMTALVKKVATKLRDATEALKADPNTPDPLTLHYTCGSRHPGCGAVDYGIEHPCDECITLLQKWGIIRQEGDEQDMPENIWLDGRWFNTTSE
jgi:hypothetical protein